MSPKQKYNIVNSEAHQRNHQLASQIQLIEELNGQNIYEQDKDVEIERLQTTCHTLNQKVFLLEDVRKEMVVIKNRKDEQERARDLLEEEVLQLKKQNFLLKEKNGLLEKR